MNSANTVSPRYIHFYFLNLVNAFYKILPMAENKEPTRIGYMCNLRREMLGMQCLIETLGRNTGFLSLLNILSYFINNPDCDEDIVRSDVFKAISICKHIAAEYRR